MGTRRALAAMTATTVVLALAASSCARAAETSEVSTDAPEKVSLQTSTTVARSASGTGSSATRSTKAGSGDLDECNGRVGVTPEFPEGTYYYCITTEFPQLSRQWKGTADPSFQKRGGPPDGPRGGPRRGGPGMRRPPGRPEDTFLPRTLF